MKRLLLLSNSKIRNQNILEHARDWVRSFLGNDVKTIALLTYAAYPSMGHDVFKICKEIFTPVFKALGYKVSIPTFKKRSVEKAIKRSDAIVVIDGNTFYLLDFLYKHSLLDLIEQKVNDGMPYIGWGAGSNIACPTLKTTNDMPIVEPVSINAFNFVPFQIDLNHPDEDHDINSNCKKQENKLKEFMRANTLPVVGLRDDSAIEIVGTYYKVLGSKRVKLFYGEHIDESKYIIDI